MKRLRRSYVIIITLLVLTVTFFGASYAFFSNINEQHGKLNIVVGGLTYQLESEDLDKNKITMSAGESKEIVIKLTSLNTINSKYELYYLVDDNSDVEIGYSANTKDAVLGTIGSYEMKEITVVIKNNSSNDITIEFSVLGGLIRNELVLNEGNSLNNELAMYQNYNIGDEITLTDGSKWHVLEASDENTETVVLLSDYNLNSDGTYNTECGSTIDGIYRCSPMAYDSDNTNKYDESDSNNIGYFIKNAYTSLVLADLPDATNITLPTAEQIANADSQTFNATALTLNSSWLITTNYWTKTYDEKWLTNVWDVRGMDSKIYSDSSIYTSWGARPTITVPKNYIVDTMSSTAELTIGTSVTAIDGSKWHVLEASGSDSKYVTLLSDYNLNSDGTYNTTCQGITGNVESYWCSPMVFDDDNTQIYDENDSNNIGYFIKNIYAPKVTSLLFETINVTLPNADQIALADNQVFNEEVLTLTSSWLLTTNYWTKTARSSISNNVWVTRGQNSRIGDDYANYSIRNGARPVITTLKTNLMLN